MSREPKEPDEPPLDPGDAEALGRLERLVVECLARFESDGPPAIDAVCAENPDDAAELRARMRVLVEGRLIDSPEDEVPERLGDFRLLRVLGGGGMGVVYLAHDDSLAREVALKLIRPDHLYFPGARERFRREVELVAGLHHPGIVPVFSTGEERGLPFFAMERVRGCTLGEALEELVGSDPEGLSGGDLARAIGARLARTTGEASVDRRAETFRGTWSDTCARVVAELAEALAHAHAHGVLHRDLKPSNAMVTFDGRVQLFDFGLSTSQEAGKLTRTGSVLGSLPYMSPEQIDAQPVDERSDIYALGVSLYEMLTLVQPFAGKGALAARDAILSGSCEPPRARNARIPRDLETVCRKAMSPESSQRYASAADFALDLRNVLARRPVKARRAGVMLRAMRLAQRHPWQTAAVLLAGLVVVGGPLGFALQRSIANARLTEALEATARERTRAEENLDRAIGAVKTMLQEVGAETLESVPGLGPRRAALLEEALALFDELLAQRADDPRLIRQRAELLRETAYVLSALGRFDEAEARARQAVALLAARSDQDADWQLAWDLGLCHAALARVQDQARADGDALAEARLALDAFESAASRAADAGELTRRTRAEHARTIALAKSNLGLSLHELGDHAEALSLAEAAVVEAELALGFAAEDSELGYTLATVLSSLAYVTPDQEQGRDAAERAVELFEQSFGEEEDPRRITQLARAHHRAARARLELEGFDAARAGFEAGYRLLSALVQEHPYYEDLHVALLENRYAFARAHPDEEQAPLLAECVELIAAFAAGRPESLEPRYRETAIRSNHVWSLLIREEFEAAAVAADEAVAVSERFVADFPDAIDHWQSVFVHISRGSIQANLGIEPDLDGIERVVLERAAVQERALRGAGMIFAMWCGVLDERGDAPELRETVARRGLDLLERSIEHGFDRAPLLLEEPNWAALREHPRMIELCTPKL